MTEPGLIDTDTVHRLARRIASVLTLEPDAGAIEYDGRWTTWGQLAALAERIKDICLETSAGDVPHVGILLRNRPAHVAAFLGVLLAGGCVVVINPSRGDARTRSDIADLTLPIVIGEADDLRNLVDPQPTTTVVTITDLTIEPEVASATANSGDPADDGSGTAVLMLTSGTTGPPKRVALTYDMLARSVLGADDGSNEKSSSAPARLSSGVAIVNAPLVHIGGVFRTLQCIVAARPYVLLPRFEIGSWADAVRRYRPRAVSLVPTAVRMVLHSDLTRDDLSSIRVVTSGTAPLSAEDADAFTDKFDIPVLTSYAATEFGGGVAGWTLADHREFWETKRGSVGRADPGSRLRVVADDGTVLGPDETGLLEVAPGQLGPSADWIRTTDLARIDGDGFLWIVGRADQAIIRGGFKVIPDDVRAALESHPSVEGASVVGRPDDRLGATPVAMVELRSGETVSEDELAEYLSDRLARYEIPTAIIIVDAIPRTPSGKADLTAVRSRLESSE
ncbi:class I adenylate-forming enzyme family protein [Gordonia sp. SL306]|uniref:class I adenylate-forming enzyme family protein n=1 Tax=Gordonia sp. SL306 TaxID=2995145 RepID=UPI0022722CD1|nr:AMP-binding protein [Gordonia sp. SL306]WAC57102.1 AMP-binding protein [Gordonia sp. SL306]